MQISDFDDTKRGWLKYGLAGFLNTHPDLVFIEDVSEGSVVVRISLPEEAADELIARWMDFELKAYLAPLEVVDVRLASSDLRMPVSLVPVREEPRGEPSTDQVPGAQLFPDVVPGNTDSSVGDGVGRFWMMFGLLVFAIGVCLTLLVPGLRLWSLSLIVAVSTAILAYRIGAIIHRIVHRNDSGPKSTSGSSDDARDGAGLPWCAGGSPWWADATPNYDELDGWADANCGQSCSDEGHWGGADGGERDRGEGDGGEGGGNVDSDDWN